MQKTIFLKILLMSILTIMGQAFIKRGLSLASAGGIDTDTLLKLVANFFKLIQNKYIIIGASLTLLGTLTWVTVISKKDLTAVIPILGGVFYILLFLISWLFLKEEITLWKVIGTTIILIGIYIFSIKVS